MLYYYKYFGKVAEVAKYGGMKKPKTALKCQAKIAVIQKNALSI